MTKLTKGYFNRAYRSGAFRSDESPLVLGDELPEKYARVLRAMKTKQERRKAKGTYLPPDDDELIIGSANKRRRP